MPEKFINILHSRIEPGMKQPERMRRVGYDDDLRPDAERVKLVAHLFALLKRSIPTAVDEKQGCAVTVYVGDWRCFAPHVRFFFESSADESRVRVVRAFDLFFDVAGIDESDRAVD